jgi:hypothetical protein
MPNGNDPKEPKDPKPGSGGATTQGGHTQPPQTKVVVAAAIGGLVGGLIGALIGSGMH